MSEEIEEKRPRLETNEAESTPVKNYSSPIPILRKELLEDVPLRKAFIGILRNKKDTAVAIKSATTALPVCGHLKRCAGHRLLLAFVKLPEDDGPDLSFATAEDLKTFLIAKKFDLNILKDTLEVVRVPEKPPRTKSQFTKASEAWPVNFHPDSSIELLVNGNFFDSQQLEVIDSCMRICIDVAKSQAIGNENCNGSAVILDPDEAGTSRILAISASRVNEHPMWHAAMLGVDLVARIRGGGAWNLHPSAEVENIDKTDRKRELSSEHLPLFYPESLKSLDIPCFSFPSVLKTKPADEKGPYLCTGYWIFLLKEPCPLCAMALLHSRVSMIFYGTANPQRGVLGSRAVFHTIPGLNHRYKVWSNILESECRMTSLDLPVI